MLRRSRLRSRKPAAELSPRGLALRAKRKAERERRKRARHAAQFGPQAELCRRGPCQGCGRAVACEAHHEPPRSHGGTDRDTAALCPFGERGAPGCHPLRHKLGRVAFEAHVGRSVSSMVEEMRERLAAQEGRSPCGK